MFADLKMIRTFAPLSTESTSDKEVLERWQINAENQQIAKQTPSFTPKNVKLGVFVLFKPLVLCFGYRTVFFGSSQKVCGYNI